MATTYQRLDEEAVGEKADLKPAAVSVSGMEAGVRPGSAKWSTGAKTADAKTSAVAADAKLAGAMVSLANHPNPNPNPNPTPTPNRNPNPNPTPSPNPNQRALRQGDLTLTLILTLP